MKTSVHYTTCSYILKILLWIAPTIEKIKNTINFCQVFAFTSSVSAHKHKANTMKFLITLFTIVATTFCLAQNTIPKALDKLNKKTVPYITVEQLQSRAGIVLLDARETKEFNVSHIKNAINVGFDHFDKNAIFAKIPNKKANIIVYCSIGVRSEKIGEKLLKMGYKNVFNLYGGIFEWKNNGGEVIDNNGLKTDNVHTFNKEWSQYLKKGNKIYED